MQFKTVAELTALNQQLHQSAEAFIKKSDSAKAEITKIREEVNSRYFEPDSTFSNMSKNKRAQFADAEIRQRTNKVIKRFDEESKGMLRGVGGIAEEIQSAQELYEPVRRLSLETAEGDAAKSRAAVQQLLAGASQPEIETLLAKFQATNDLPGLAAISSVTSRDARLRKAIPNARIVATVKFGDEDQVSAIFHAGTNMTNVLVDEMRSVSGHSRNQRLNAGLRKMAIRNGKVVDTRNGVAKEDAE